MKCVAVPALELFFVEKISVVSYFLYFVRDFSELGVLVPLCEIPRVAGIEGWVGSLLVASPQGLVDQLLLLLFADQVTLTEG